jgi:hypothetical protein
MQSSSPLAFETYQTFEHMFLNQLKHVWVIPLQLPVKPHTVFSPFMGTTSQAFRSSGAHHAIILHYQQHLKVHYKNAYI